MTGRVVHVRDNVEGAIYIGRAMPRYQLKASPFANPFTITNTFGAASIGERRRVVAQYKADLLTNRRHLLADLPALRDKPLACWCRHDGEQRTPLTVCHGDILLALLSRFTDEQLLAKSRETIP